jgi:phosphatidylinositol alpha-1,6-mannosyltransferase
MDKIIVLAPMMKDAKEFDQNENIKTYRYFPGLMGLNLIEKFFRFMVVLIYALFIVKTKNVGMIHAGQPVITGLVAKIIKKIYKIPYAVYVYGGELLKFKGSWLLKLCIDNIKNADYVITNSKFTSDEVARFLPEIKSEYIYPGVNTEYFVPGVNADGLREKFNLHGKKVIMTIARLAKRKGHHLVLPALKELILESPELVYVIGGDGEERENLEKLVDQYGLERNVVFAGNLGDDELPAYYNLADIFIMPNIELFADDPVEGFGISFVEAGSCEKPVIGGRTGGAVEAIKENETGLLVDPYNKDEVKEAIRYLLNNPEIASQMGKDGRKRAVRELDWKILSKSFIKYLA